MGCGGTAHAETLRRGADVPGGGCARRRTAASDLILRIVINNVKGMRRPLLAFVLAASVVAIAGCASSGPAPQERTAHLVDGADGAAEVAAPAAALVVVGRRGDVTLLDLETEERAVIAEADGALAIGGGRFVHLVREHAESVTVEVVDTGRWTVPHGDHSHSFRAEPRVVGSLEGRGPAGDVRIGVGQASTAVRFGDGEIASFAHDAETPDAEALPADSPAGDERMPADAASAPPFPFAGHLLVADAEAIRVLDETGEPVGDATPCAEPSDVDLTRVGAVFVCAGGAVLFTRQTGGDVLAERIPHPAGARVSGLAGRADRPDLAGVAGDGGAWLLDVRARTWSPLPSEVLLVRAVALGDDASRTAAIDRDGRLRILGPDGTLLLISEPLHGGAASSDRTQLLVDADSAYVTDPEAGVVHEIDLGTARIIRTFADLDPQIMQLVG